MGKQIHTEKFDESLEIKQNGKEKFGSNKKKSQPNTVKIVFRLIFSVAKKKTNSKFRPLSHHDDCVH